MLLSEDREIRLRVSAEHSDRSKEEAPTDNCSSDSSSNCYYFLQSQQFGMDLKSQNANQRETKALMERLNSLRLVQSTMTQKFEMCIKKLEHELDSKEAQNDFLREELKVMRREIKETKNDILLMK
jgi:septal ring factor EnvC (AmiA/AmiB activator)